jgi:alkylation response protein AidB-like acyl-CoA dehydrogenase
MMLAITREVIAQNDPTAYRVLSEPELMGFTAVTGPHARYTNFKVPADHLIFAPGKAVPVIEQAFTVTAPLAAAMAVGTMRSAFELALKFSKEDNRGGSVPIIKRQSVADLLMGSKMRIDTSRLLVWKALDGLDRYGPSDATVLEYCLQAKIYGGDAAVPAVYECMQVVGM